MATVKINTKYNCIKPGTTPVKETTYTVVVKDKAGNELRNNVQISLLKCFSTVARDEIGDRPTIDAGKKLALTIPFGGETVPSTQASLHILDWMTANSKLPRNAQVLDICCAGHRHNAMQLVHVAAAATVFNIQPREARNKQAEMAIDAVAALTKAGKLHPELVVAAVRLFPKDHHVVRRMMTAIAKVAIRMEEKAENDVYEVMNETVKKLPLIDKPFSKGINSSKAALWFVENKKKARKEQVAAKKAAKKEAAAASKTT